MRITQSPKIKDGKHELITLFLTFAKVNFSTEGQQKLNFTRSEYGYKVCFVASPFSCQNVK